MAKYVVNDDIKNQILDLYFNKNETMKKISETVGITRNTISNILHQDNRFFIKRKIIKEERLKKPQRRKLIFNKNGQTYNIKISLPYDYIEKLGFNISNRIANVELDEKNDQIIIYKEK
ncbi:sigma factor-like helix-turn-helix DNA-binding protein [uncultured Clostridium sp.]|jgi:predicted transcriptional regulator|uniref:sigma factor-like helix-turn-helix DNA-binding protein n=1 Tax=uncultured Clostridium sp. TaxID=59620 RepID=UPI00272AE934|nr:hypothetical protein [uncultured Clostridium sp.]